MSGVFAQGDYPAKTIKLIVPYPPGGVADIMPRIVAQKLVETLKQTIVVENKPGAGGNVGTDFVAKSSPDGYTLIVGTNGPIAINKWLYKDMPYDQEKDLAPVALLGTAPQFLAVNPSSPARTVPEFVAWAKSKPGGLFYGSVASGSASHLAMEMLKTRAGVQLTHIPYKGLAPALNDLVGGQVSAMFVVSGGAAAQVKGGTLRALAVTGSSRLSAFPDVPSMTEAGYSDFQANAWVGLLAPKNTPAGIVRKLNAAVVHALQLPDVKARWEAMGMQFSGMTPEEFGAFVHSESTQWAKVIRDTGAKLD